MHGNVREWCLDYFTADTSSLNGAVNTTSDPTYGRGRVIRGLDWTCEADWNRPAVRNYEVPGTRSAAQSANIGFRVACPVDVP